MWPVSAHPEFDRPIEVAEVEALGDFVAPVGGERRPAVAPRVVFGPGDGDARGERPLDGAAELARHEAGAGREGLLGARQPQVGPERPGVGEADVGVRNLVEEPERDGGVLFLGEEGEESEEGVHTWH
jgi:hypothetical protein